MRHFSIRLRAKGSAPVNSRDSASRCQCAPCKRGRPVEPIGNLLGELGAVCHDDQDRLLLTVKIEQQRRDSFRRGAVEVAGRLVAQEQPGRAHQRARDGDPLPLAARQLARPMIDAVFEPDLLTSSTGPPASLAILPPSSFGDKRRNQDVLEHRALRQQAVILENKADRSLRNAASLAADS